MHSLDILYENQKTKLKKIFFRTVSNVIGVILILSAVYELVKIYLQFRVFGEIKKEENGTGPEPIKA